MNSYSDLMKGMQGPLINGGANPGAPLPPMEVNRYGNQVSIVPHVRTFNTIAQWMSRTYRFRFDEALQRNYNSAKAMRNDAFIQGLYRKRMTPVTKSDFTIESEGPGASEEVNAFYKSILEQTPQWHEFRRNVGECVWYGRYGVQMAFDELTYEGRAFQWKGNKAVGISHWLPHLGDKITFTFDFFPCIRVSPIYVSTWKAKGATILGPTDPRIVQEAASYRWTEEGPVIVLDNPEVRKEFVISIFEIQDAPWDEPTLAGGIRGVGLRHYTFWNWDNKQEIVGWAMNYLEEFGAGGYTVVAYDGPEGLRRQQAAFADPTQKIIFVPIIPGTEEKVTDSVTRLEPATTGNDAIMKWAQDYFGADLVMLYLGHPLNASSGSTGLGSSASDRAADDLKLINRSDAEIIDTAMSHEVLPRLKKYNDPSGQYSLKFVSAIRSIDKKAGMEATDTLYKWGGKIPKAYAYMLADVPMLKPDEEFLQDPAHAQADMQMQAQQVALGGGADTSYMERGSQHAEAVDSIFSGGNEATLETAQRSLMQAGVPKEDVLGTLAAAVSSGQIEEHDIQGGVHYTKPGKDALDGDGKRIDPDYEPKEKTVSYSVETDPASKWTEETGPISGKPRWRNNETGRIQYKQPGTGRHVQAVDRSEGKTPGFKLDQGKYGVGVGLLPGKGLATGVVEDRVLQLAKEGGKSLQGEGVLAEVMHVDKRLMKAQAISLAAKLGLQIDSKTSKTQALAHIENTLRNKQQQAKGQTASPVSPSGQMTPGKAKGNPDSSLKESAPLLAMSEKSDKTPENKGEQRGHVAANTPEKPSEAVDTPGQVAMPAKVEDPISDAGSPAVPDGEAVPADSPDSTVAGVQPVGGMGSETPSAGAAKPAPLGIPPKSNLEQVRDIAKTKYKEEVGKVEEHNAMIRSAFSSLLSQDDPNNKDGLFTRTGKVRRDKLMSYQDYASVPGLIDAAKTMAGLYNDHFDVNGAHEKDGFNDERVTAAEQANAAKLLKYLQEGPLDRPKLEDIENQAFQEWYDSHPGQGDAAEPEKWDDVEFDPATFGDIYGNRENGGGQLQGDSLESDTDSEQRNAGNASSDQEPLSGDPGAWGDSSYPTPFAEAFGKTDQLGSGPDGQGDSGGVEHRTDDGQDSLRDSEAGGSGEGNDYHPSGVDPNAQQGSEAGRALHETEESPLPERQGSGGDHASDGGEVQQPGDSQEGFMAPGEAGKHSADDIAGYAGQSFTNDQGLTIDVNHEEGGTWGVGKRTGLTAQGAANYLNELKAEKAQGLFSPEVTAQAPVAKQAEKWEWSKPTTKQEAGELPGMKDTFAPGMFAAGSAQREQPSEGGDMPAFKTRDEHNSYDSFATDYGRLAHDMDTAMSKDHISHNSAEMKANKLKEKYPLWAEKWHEENGADTRKSSAIATLEAKHKELTGRMAKSAADKAEAVKGHIDQLKKYGQADTMEDYFARMPGTEQRGHVAATEQVKPTSTQKAVDTLKAGMQALGGKADESGKSSQQVGESRGSVPAQAPESDSQGKAVNEGGAVAGVESTPKAQEESQESGSDADEKFTIEKFEGTQIGYRKTGSREKNARKTGGYLATDSSGYQRHFNTKKEAQQFIEGYTGKPHVEPAKPKAKAEKPRWNGETPGAVVPVGKDSPHNLGERLKGASKSKAIEMLKEVKADQWSRQDLVELGNANSMALSPQMSNNTMIGLILEKLDVRHKAIKKVLTKMDKAGGSKSGIYGMSPEQVGESSVSHYMGGMNKDHKHFTSWRDWKEAVVSHMKNHRDS